MDWLAISSHWVCCTHFAISQIKFVECMKKSEFNAKRLERRMARTSFTRELEVQPVLPESFAGNSDVLVETGDSEWMYYSP